MKHKGGICNVCGHTWEQHDLATLNHLVCCVEGCKCDDIKHPNLILTNDHIRVEATKEGLSIALQDSDTELEWVIPLKRIRSMQVLAEKLSGIHQLLTTPHTKLVNYENFSAQGLYNFCTPDIGQAINRLIDLIQLLEKEG